MSDSFADLWSSSAPLPPKSKPPTLSSSSSSSTGIARQNSSTTPNYGSNSGSKPDLFAMLSSSGSGSGTATPRYGGGSGSGINNGIGGRPSNPPSRTMTPSTSSALGLGSGSGSGLGGASIARTSSAAGVAGADAFSDLFSSASGTGSGAAVSRNMTLAARLAMEAEQKRGGGTGMGFGRVSPAVGAAGGSDAAWAGLDSLAGGGMLKATPPPPATSSSFSATRNQPNVDEDDWGLRDFGSSASAAASGVTATAHARTKTRTQTTARSIEAAAASKADKKAGVSLWDLEDFKNTTNEGSSSWDTNGKSNARTYSPDPPSAPGNPPRSSKPLFFEDDNGGVASPDRDFDFGSREDLDERDRAQGRGRGLLDFDEGEDDFGFGAGNGSAREGRVNGNRHGDHRGGDQEDDILGMLSKPVEVVRARVGVVEDTQPRNQPQQPSRPSSNNIIPSRGRVPSPPPHILGQIVEMGFSVTQAKKALSGTKDGMDVQAALESLLGGGSGSGTPAEQRSTLPSPPPPAAPRARGPPKGQKERERERLEKQQRLAAASSSASSSSGPALNTENITEQADKLLAQASEIGMNMFSKASAFWREGKERVVKAYEEREAGGGMPGLAPGARQRGAARPGGGGGMPKWMMEGAAAEQEDEDNFTRRSGKEKERDGFRDGWESEEEERQDSRPDMIELFGESKEAEVEVDLFAPDQPPTAAPSSPNRLQPPSRVEQRPQGSTTSRASARNPARPSPSPPSSQRARTPVPAPTRTLPTASSSALALAIKHKTTGTEQFKLGQHAAAAESYGLALQALPEGHLLRVPLFTNRAIARLRIGEYKTAVVDCEHAVEGVVGQAVFGAKAGSEGGEFGVEDPLATRAKDASKVAPPPLLHPSAIPPAILSAGRSKANEGGWAHPQGLGVDLLDQYVKALKRAAEALEGRERWEEAGVWWGVLGRAAEGEAGAWVQERERKEAVSGGVRCRRMVEGGGSGSASAKSTPAVTSVPKPQVRRPPPKSTSSSTSSAPSRAVQALQSTTAQAEADDAARHVLKDTVDARLSAWKSGKETNIRALLASLENVLWEGEVMRGLKMGMADLVSAGQVKKGYVKAIARVHPDKLNAGNSTLEQRMLANGVFGGLNEAWIAFQATQK